MVGLVRAGVLAAAVVIAAALAVARDDGDDLSSPAPAVALRPERVPDSADHECAGCHARVVDEWAGSAHGVAWLDEDYQAALADRTRPELCHGCHIPEPLLAQEALPRRVRARPETGAEPLGHGVSCQACHLGANGELLGARGAETDAHATAADGRLSLAGSNALCAACHRTSIGPVVGIARDFETAGLAERGLSCLGCHAAEVESGGRMVRSHAIQTPRDPTFLRRAFEVEASSDGGVHVTIGNLAGHRVPGLRGRVVAFRAELLDGAGQVVSSGTLELTTKTFLPVEQARDIALAGAGVEVRVRGDHVDPRAEEPIPFLDVRLALGGE